MDVLIRLEQAVPPVGTVLPVGDIGAAKFESGEALRFIGWLGLLRALAEIVEEPRD